MTTNEQSKDTVDALLQERELQTRINNIPFEPMALWVVVERDPPKEKIGTLVVPETQRTPTSRGTVLAVGAGMMTDFGAMRKIHPSIKPGVVIQWDAGSPETRTPQGVIPAKVTSNDIEVQGQVYTLIPAGVIILVEKPSRSSASSPE